ncbi:hypothetical protein [Clostridium sporogenes]|uniref:hypothetical protein n=1 Tax=Clostridium sporogenes TaxID=1509 RepID=UPI0013D27E6C|nr:hypothetical protein [Clostridium sporogenes]NFH40684.1 hypothetical protein [Clostridium sporogenes]
MKDYSNFNPNPINKLLWSSQKVFNNQLKFEGQEIEIEKNTIKAIVRNHSNPTNEFKEERFLITGKDIKVKRGYTIKYLNEYYLINSDVDRDNPIYNTCKMKRCNNIITFQYKNKVYEYPCILNNATLYSDGMEVKQMILSNDQRGCLIPYNDFTNKIQLQQRFIFNHNSAFSVSLIDDFTFKQANDDNGLLQLTMIREMEKNNLDDLENNLADNSQLKKEEPIVLQIDNKTIQLEINKTYQLNPKLFQGNKEITSQEELNKINYTVDDNSIVKIENGLITSLQKGNTNIQVCYDEQVISIPIQVTDISVHSGTCNIIGNDFIKIGKLSKWTVELYDSQGDKINGKVEWNIVGEDIDELIKIKEKTSNSIVLLAHKKQENIGKKFIIKCKTLDGLSFDKQEIILKSLI